MLDKITFCTKRKNNKLYGDSSTTIEFGKQTISIDGKKYWCFINESSIRNFEYDIDSNDNFKRKGNDKSIICKILSIDNESIYQEINKLSYIVDYQFDELRHTKKKSFLYIGDFYAEVDLIGIKFSKYLINNHYMQLEFIFSSDDWIWYRDININYDPNIYDDAEFWREYKNGGRGYDYGYGFSNNIIKTINPSIANGSFRTLAHIEIYFYGAFENPYIDFSGIKKGVYQKIKDDEYIIFSSREKTIKLIEKNGEYKNLFDKRMINDVFPTFGKIILPCTIKLPTGMKFSIIIREERSSPLWI